MPRGSAAERGNELSSSDVDWHVSLPWGMCTCRRGKISRFEDGTNNAFALLKPIAVHVSVGSIATEEVEVTPSRMSASPLKAYNLTPSQQVRLVPISDICGATKVAHSITSSARASSVGGTSRPSAFGRCALQRNLPAYVGSGSD